jgi:predicted hydrocarbon binding protein
MMKVLTINRNSTLKIESCFECPLSEDHEPICHIVNDYRRDFSSHYDPRCPLEDE